MKKTIWGETRPTVTTLAERRVKLALHDFCKDSVLPHVRSIICLPSAPSLTYDKSFLVFTPATLSPFPVSFACPHRTSRRTWAEPRLFSASYDSGGEKVKTRPRLARRHGDVLAYLLRTRPCNIITSGGDIWHKTGISLPKKGNVLIRVGT